MTRNWSSSALAIFAVLLSFTLALSPFLSTGQELAESRRASVPAQADVKQSGVTSRLGLSVASSRNLLGGRFGAPRAKSKTSGGNPIFFNPASYVTGGVYSFAVATGDFNGDGKADLVVANECPASSCGAGSVSVLLGNGDGTFQAAQSYGSGGYEAFSVAVGDVNGDGKADLVVANGCQSNSQCTSGVVGVLLGHGDGTFQAAQSYFSGGVVASSVALADLNGDGYLDVVVANQCQDASCANGSVSVLLGNGNGKFQSAQSYASGGLTAVSVAIGDFNRDGTPDLAVANRCQSSGSCNGSVGVLIGNGDGTFQAAQSYASGGFTAVSVATGDFDGDKKTDLVVANQCQASGNCSYGNAGVLLGNGDGTFRAAQTYVSGGNSTASVAVADLNGDGHPDLLLANQCQVRSNCSDGMVSLLLGNGDGTFQTASNYFSDGVFVNSIATGNWNGGRKADLAVVNQCQNNSSCNGAVTVMLGNGDGTLQAPPSFASGAYDVDAVAAGDLNGDGKLDLVVANLCTSSNCSQGNNGAVAVLRGNGDGTFQPAQTYATGGFGSSSVALADLNHDGKVDVIVTNQCSTNDCGSGGSVSVLLGNGDGTLQAAATYSSGAYTALSVAVGDFNNDGIPDLAVGDQCQDSTCESGAVSILLGKGDGTFLHARIYGSAGYQTDSVAAGDFNGDGNLDLVLASQCQDSSCRNGGVSLLLGNGDGTFQAAQSFNSLGAQADSVAVTDVNGDGKLDLVVSDFCREVTRCDNGLITSFIGNGDGTFREGRTFSSGGLDAYSVVAKDFNGDGNVDVVVANSDGTCLLLGNGDGTFQNAIAYYPGGGFVAAGDFNGNKQPDLAIADGSLSAVTILLNVVAGFRQATTTTLTSSPNPSSVDQSVLFTATVSAALGGSPTGTVTFKSGTTKLGTSNLSNGQATLNYAFTRYGVNTITAAYSGDSNFLPSTSAPLKQQVVKANTTTTLTSAPNPSNLGQVVKFTATVTGQYGGTPTGIVTFKNNGQVMAQVTLHNGVAKYKTSTLTKGSHHIVADYGGDNNFHYGYGQLTQVVQ